MAFFERLAKWWAIPDDTLPQKIDCIIAIDYGCRPEGLPRATRKIFERATVLQKKHPNACIAFTNSSHCFQGSEILSSKFKKKILAQLGVSSRSYIETGPSNNSVTEGEAIQNALLAHKKDIQNILVICEETHARSVMFFWKKLFPHAHIYGKFIPFEFGYGHEYTIFLERSLGWWICANMARHTALLLFGFTWTKYFVHPAIKQKEKS